MKTHFALQHPKYKYQIQIKKTLLETKSEEFFELLR